MRKAISFLVWSLVAMLGGGRAAAVAPIMYDLPSPVVGRAVGPSQTASYVYPDAFDLANMANDLLNDPPTSSTQLKWSYEIVGTPKYAINGLPAINTSVMDPANPPDTYNVMKTVAPQEANPDGKPRTVTIRNIRLSPLVGTPETDDTPDIIDRQAITFYCSNGTAVASQTLMFFTDNSPWGWNRLSRRNPPIPQPPPPIIKFYPVGDPIGSVTTNTWGTTGRGFCFNVPKAGDNIWSMQSQYRPFTLTANSVYRIRATMNCSQATPGKTPFWDFIIENWSDREQKGLNLYGMDTFYLDNEGGANSVVTTQNGTEFTMIWAPIAFQTPQWNDMTNGIYSTKYAPNKDPYLRYRIMDAVANPGLMSDQKFGQLCLQQVIVESVPYNRIVQQTTPYSVAIPKAASNTPPGGNVYTQSLVGTAITYPNNTLTLQPSTAAASDELVTIFPATDLNGAGGANITPPYTQIADDWPIPWQSGKMYMVEADLSAPDTQHERHPFDVLWMSMEPPTNEVDCESYVTANQGIAMPKAGTPQTYIFFYYSMNETKSAVGALHFLRWRLRFGNSHALNFPYASDVTNTGGVRVHGVRVRTVAVQ